MDVLIVALHKGIGHTPAALVSVPGVDIVVGHHAHILCGIEAYKGRPIYHGQGNFDTVRRALNIESNPSPKRREWERYRRVLFGFEPDPNFIIYRFNPEAQNAVITVCDIGAKDVRKAGFIPCWVNPKGQPELCSDDERGRSFASYFEQITRKPRSAPISNETAVESAVNAARGNLPLFLLGLGGYVFGHSDGALD